MTATNGKARFLDNLIPLRGETFGPQLAGWTPGPPVAAGVGCKVYANQMVPVADGVLHETRLVSHERVRRVLRSAGYSKDQIDDVLRDFPDPIDLEHAREKLLQPWISVGALMDRLGASP